MAERQPNPYHGRAGGGGYARGDGGGEIGDGGEQGRSDGSYEGLGGFETALGKGWSAMVFAKVGMLMWW